MIANWALKEADEGLNTLNRYCPCCLHHNWLTNTPCQPHIQPQYHEEVLGHSFPRRRLPRHSRTGGGSRRAKNLSPAGRAATLIQLATAG